MARERADSLPPPGDDSAIEAHVQTAREAGRGFQPAPQPKPGEQPDPPAGTIPADAGPSDDEIRGTRYRAVGAVGIHEDGAEIGEYHWSPGRIRRLLAEGKIEPAGRREQSK